MNIFRICIYLSFLYIFLLPAHQLMAQDSDSNPSGVTLKSQFDDLQRRTRIYEGFRAIREDLFQEIKKQSIDSLEQAKQLVKQKEAELLQLTVENQQIQAGAEEANANLLKAVSEQNSITLFGKPVSKTFYTLLVWIIIGLLIVINLLVLLMFRNARHISRKRLEDFSDLLEEYETFRKSSRERLERATIDYFNEIKRLKGL